MLLATDDGSVGNVDLLFDLREAVPFSGIAKENRLDARILKSNEKLLFFRHGNVVVVLAVNDERRRMSGSYYASMASVPMQHPSGFPDVGKVSLSEKNHFLDLTRV